jgi:hypothetical protein
MSGAVMDKSTVVARTMSSGYQVYSSRWYALAMFCAINFCNSLLWVTFSPISDITGALLLLR